MTVVLITTTDRYLGLSSDTKPTSAPAGSTFYETDSGASYVYDGSAWQLRLDLGPFRATKTVAFTGAAGLGAVGSVSLFTVTGEVLIALLVPFCTEDLAGATATLALGVTGATTLFITATTATDIDVDEFWVDDAPDANGVPVPGALKDVAVEENIIATVGTAAITDGTIEFTAYWIPISSDGLVVAA